MNLNSKNDSHTENNSEFSSSNSNNLHNQFDNNNQNYQSNTTANNIMNNNNQNNNNNIETNVDIFNMQPIPSPIQSDTADNSNLSEIVPESDSKIPNSNPNLNSQPNNINETSSLNNTTKTDEAAFNISPTQNNSSQLIDDELLKAFIGNNYEKITTKPFNFAGFFFTTFYMFYRKMFLYALIVFLINLVILNVINDSFITAVFNFLVGLFVNKIYLHHANNKINKIKINNPQKSIDEIKGICASTGGTSIGKLFLGLFVEIIIGIVVLIIMAIIGITSAFGNLFFGEEGIIKFGAQDGTYDGVLIYDNSVTMLNEFSIAIPDKFKESRSNGNDSIVYEYSSGNNIFNSCSFSFRGISDYSSAEELINQMQKYYISNNSSSVKKENINGISWYYFNYNSAFGQNYYYGTTKDNKVYLFEYEVQKDTDSSCLSYKDQIINSIKSK